MYEQIENIDECLYNHVNFELGSFGYGLMESHGYYDDISDLVNPIVKLISKDIFEIKNGHRLSKAYNDMSIFDDSKTFFDNILIDVSIVYSEDLNENKIIGVYDYNSKMSSNNGKISFFPEIQIIGSIKSKTDFISKLYRTVGHELTHAYNDYMTFKKSGKRVVDSYKQGDVNMSLSSNDGLKKAIGYILYVTSQLETNSHIAQIKQELEEYNGSFITSFDLTKALMQTDYYKKLDGSEAILNKLKSYVDEGNDVINEIITRYASELSKKQLKNANQSIKYLGTRIYNSKRKFNQTASKIAHDVFVEKNKSKSIDKL
jgi:hypothetical protein